MRVTLDTNVYVSALHFGGRAARLLGLAQAGTIRIDNLAGDRGRACARLAGGLRMGWIPYTLLRQRLLRLTYRVSPTRPVTAVDDVDDNKILECAMEAGSQYVVTDDRARLRIGEYERIKICRVSDFLEELR